MSDAQHPREPDPNLLPARLALYLGVGHVALGAGVLYMGYNGVANNPYPEAQNPYIVSGGIGGLALLMLGGISLASSAVLRVMGDLRHELQAARESLVRANRVASSVPAPPITPEVVAAKSTNGHVLVSSGGSSYHRADCRLVERAEQVEKVPRGEATAQGLHPCRVCNP